MLCPSDKGSPAFASLLNEIGLKRACPIGPKSTSTGTTVLKAKEVNVVVDVCNNQKLFSYEMESFMIENTVSTWNKLSLSAPGGLVTWHCESTDIDKKKEGHNVCWITGSTQFKCNQVIEDFELFNFGKIQTLVSLSIGDKKLLFARVEKYNTVDYMFGDIWICERSSAKNMAFLPLFVLSQPVMTANYENNRIAILNSHVRFMPIHARVLLNHIRSK